MRFAFLLKANADSESSKLPPTEVLTAMMAYNTSLVDANVLVSGDGFAASSEDLRIVFPEPGKTEVVNGPFPINEVVCGFWIVEVNSQEEAVEWAKKVPLGGGAVLEVRKIKVAEDMGDAFTEELKEEAARLRERVTAAKETK